MIGSSENRVSYNGNGNAKEFAFEFKILNASDIKVLLVNADGTEKLLTKDYFVDIEKSVVRYPGYAPGAELPLEQQPPILPAGSKLVLYREVPITQQTKLDQFWPFNVIEAALDKLTIICQQLSDGFSRCLKLSESVPKDVNPTIPVEVGKSFRWSDDGKKIVLTDDPAKVLPQANEVLKRTEAARDVAVAKADAAGASAVSAAESEVAADRSATQAEAAKTNAKASEVAAKASQAAAKVSETNAKTSETNALTHENNAKASADKAKVSETNAGASASTATTKASQASVSATNAQRAASQADVSAVQAGHAMTNATAKAEEASVSAANAKTSETAAKVSEGKAKASETNAKTSETNAGKSATTATTKASEASVSATNAKASETAAKVSETNAKSSEGKAKTSETNAGVSAATATQQATKATTEANRAKTEADRAKTAADSVGNPVVNITQSNGNLTITKGDGSSNTLTVTPAVASQAEAEAGVDNTKVMTPLRTKQAVEKFAPLKTVNGQKPNVSGDVEILDLTPVGDVVYRPYLRAGYVKANGATVNRADYPNLVSFATDNNLWTDSPSTEPWKYGRGNGSTTMVLPDYRNRFIQGGDITGIKGAGLPNVIGYVNYGQSNNVTGSSSLYGKDNTEGESIWTPSAATTSKNAKKIAFDANRSNSIYGAANTVQPPAIILLPQIKY